MERSQQPDGPTRSRVIRCRDFSWEGVDPKRYKADDPRWRGVLRYALVGPDPDAPFHVRYFEVEPDGFTTFERHRHQHVVIAIRGRGEVRLGDERAEIGFGDVVYVAPQEPHQFRAVGDEPLGFICIVPAERDRPVPLEPPGDA